MDAVCNKYSLVDIGAVLIVSVVIPVHDTAQFVAEAVASALAVNYENREIILVDDHSRDESRNICTDLASKNPGVVRSFSVPGDRSLGPGVARNVGVRQAHGELVAFLDSDDLYYPNRFDRDVELFRTNKELDAVFSACEVSFRTFAEEKQWEGHKTVYPEESSVNNVLRDSVAANGSLWHTNAITIRRIFFNELGGFDPALRLHEDVDLWLRIAFCGYVVPGELSVPVACYRRHGSHTYDPADVILNNYRNTMILLKFLRWAQGQKHCSRRRNRLIDEFRGSAEARLFYSLSLLRKAGCWMEAQKLLTFGARCLPGLLMRRQYWANVYRLMTWQYMR